MRLQVASYNIHRGFGRDGRYDPNRILRVLQEMDADIVALQEVEFPGPDPDQILTWLAVRLGMIAVGGPVRTSEAGTYGNALFWQVAPELARTAGRIVEGAPAPGRLEHFQAKWMPVRVKKMR